MKKLVFYPPCRWLDPDSRDCSGRFYCEAHFTHVSPARSVYTKDHKYDRG